MQLTLKEIAAACGGRLSGDGDTVITGMFFDSRKTQPGLLFVPVKGEKTDGHRFIPQVFAAGAAATFSEQPLENPPGPVVYVENSLYSMQAVAEMYRKRFTIPVVGITGSVGKTTTKEMVALAISAGRNTLKTEGNANGQFGLPLTVFRMSAEHEAAVIEMGVSIPGEMARIAKIARPTVAVMTNIGVSHIEYMKTRENILQQKFQLADYLPVGGKVFVNGDDDLLSTLQSTPEKQIVTFGLGENCVWRAVELSSSPEGTRFVCLHHGQRAEMFVPAAGEHMVRNALAAVAVAVELGVREADAIRAIRTYVPLAMRQRIFTGANHITLLDDTYNASPDSMRAALKILADLKTEGKRVAALADMLELGFYAQQGHYDVGRFARENGVDLLVGIGPLAQKIVEGFGGTAENCAWFPDNAQAISYLKTHMTAGDMLLCKGSRGMHTEEIIAAFSS